MELFWRILDTLLFAAGLAYIFIQYINPFFSNRKRQIINAINESEAAEQRAKLFLSEAQDKLEAVKLELEKLKEDVKKEALLEKEHIINEAKKSAEKMAEQYALLMQAELNKQQRKLYTEALEMSIKLAEEIIGKELTDETLNKINKNLIEKMGELVV